METLRYPQEVKANKEHICSFCGEKILTGQMYLISTHKGDSGLYDWKSHKHCDMLVDKIGIEDTDGEHGITQENFMESVSEYHFELLYALFPPEDRQKYQPVLSELRNVKWRDKLWFVIRHFAQLEEKIKTTPHE